MNKHLIFISHAFDSKKEQKDHTIYAIIKTLKEFSSKFNYHEEKLENELALFTDINNLNKREEKIFTINKITLIDINTHKNSFKKKYTDIYKGNNLNNLLVNLEIVDFYSKDYKAISVIENDLIINTKLYAQEGVNIYNHIKFDKEKEKVISEDFINILFPERRGDEIEKTIIASSLPTTFIGKNKEKVVRVFLNKLNDLAKKNIINTIWNDYNWIYYGTVMEYATSDLGVSMIPTRQIPYWSWLKKDKDEKWENYNFHRNTSLFKKKEFLDIKINKEQILEEIEFTKNNRAPGTLEDILGKKISMLNYYKDDGKIDGKFKKKVIKKILKNEKHTLKIIEEEINNKKIN